MSVTSESSTQSAMTWRCGCGIVQVGPGPCASCGWRAPEVSVPPAEAARAHTDRLPYARAPKGSRSWTGFSGRSTGGVMSKAIPVLLIVACTAVVGALVQRSTINRDPAGVGLDDAARAATTSTPASVAGPPETTPRPVGSAGATELMPVLLSPPLPGFKASPEALAALGTTGFDVSKPPEGVVHASVRGWAAPNGQQIVEFGFDGRDPFQSAQTLTSVLAGYLSRPGATSVDLGGDLNGTLIRYQDNGDVTVVAGRRIVRSFVFVIKGGEAPTTASMTELMSRQIADS